MEPPSEISVGLLVDLSNLAGMLVVRAEQLKHFGSLPPEDLVGKLSPLREVLLDLSGRILELETSWEHSPDSDLDTPAKSFANAMGSALSSAASPGGFQAEEEEAPFAPWGASSLPVGKEMPPEVAAILADLAQIAGGTAAAAPRQADAVRAVDADSATFPKALQTGPTPPKGGS